MKTTCLDFYQGRVEICCFIVAIGIRDSFSCVFIPGVGMKDGWKAQGVWRYNFVLSEGVSGVIQSQ